MHVAMFDLHLQLEEWLLRPWQQTGQSVPDTTKLEVTLEISYAMLHSL